jgi:hypothetical protein
MDTYAKLERLIGVRQTQQLQLLALSEAHCRQMTAIHHQYQQEVLAAKERMDARLRQMEELHLEHVEEITERIAQTADQLRSLFDM